MRRVVLGIALVAAALAAGCSSGPLKPPGDVRGTAWRHTNASADAVVQKAWVVIPAQATGDKTFAGLMRDAPTRIAKRVPVVVFLHGSSGISPAVRDWQKWVADELGIASIAPDSMQLPNRLTYKSPADKDTYEHIHELRAVEIVFALQALRNAPWADNSRLALAGTSEGSVAVARYAGAEFASRILYAWSCENNYFVKEHGTALPLGRPVLNVISARDPYFSKGNDWIGNPAPVGHCGPLVRDNPRGEVLLIGNAPHTLFNLPPARTVTQRFLVESLQP